MYSKSTSDRFGELNIPGNYSGNAFRLQNTVNAANTPSSPPIPGFYRQVQRKGGTNGNADSAGTRTSINSHTSFSARDTELAPHIMSTPENIIEESEHETDRTQKEFADLWNEKEVLDIEPDFDTKKKSIGLAKITDHLPESDDLLLLGLLILLMQSKGNEDLMMIIAMLLMT